MGGVVQFCAVRSDLRLLFGRSDPRASLRGFPAKPLVCMDHEYVVDLVRETGAYADGPKYRAPAGLLTIAGYIRD
jgi:hypothetical protein